MTAVYRYILGVNMKESQELLWIKKKVDVRVNRYKMAVIKFRLEVNKDPNSSQAQLAGFFKKKERKSEHFQKWLK